jgi:hypothetical protein
MFTAGVSLADVSAVVVAGKSSLFSSGISAVKSELRVNGKFSINILLKYIEPCHRYVT